MYFNETALQDPQARVRSHPRQARGVEVLPRAVDCERAADAFTKSRMTALGQRSCLSRLFGFVRNANR